MNSIRIITPYKSKGQWVFDDPSTGLAREALIAGIDKMLDIFTRDIPNASGGFNLLFSDQKFPGHNIELELVRPEFGGNWYYSPQLGFEGWLCPALFKYFKEAPKRLYGQTKALT
jgi:hypothetical protein